MPDFSKQPKYPWWEPYVFTTAVLLVFAIAFITLGYAASIPYFLPSMFALVTVGALRDAVRKPPKLVIDKAFTACFLVLMSLGAFVATKFLSLAYFGLAMAWFGLAIHAAIVQRRKKLLWLIGLLASAAFILFVYLSFVSERYKTGVSSFPPATANMPAFDPVLTEVSDGRWASWGA